MPLERAALSEAALSEAARKALAPGPMRMMAARGLAPLPRPADVASVLYQLSLDADEKMRGAAVQTAKGLPEKILSGALTDATLDAQVLDFFAEQVADKASLVQAILLNPMTSDVTVADLTTRIGGQELDIVAQNEQRLLRAPAIIGALYMNPNTRMSTVDRAIELAVRNNVEVPGIPAWDQVRAIVLGTEPVSLTKEQAAEKDVLFQIAAETAVGEDNELAKKVLEAEGEVEVAEEEKIPIDRLPIPQKIRLAMLGNAFARSVLVMDRNRLVATATIRSPQITPQEVVKYSGNKSLVEDVVLYIVGKRDWVKLYQVKVNLVNNPKTPLKDAMKLVPFLNDRDLKQLGRSKGVSSTLKNLVKRLVTAKAGGGEKK